MNIGDRKVEKRFAAQCYGSVYRYYALLEFTKKKRGPGGFWKKIAQGWGRRGNGTLHLPPISEANKFFGIE